ncbi:hypothetical protein TH24_17040 [Thalassospira xiamenensis]|nr:hypothetical protein TH24_17040 [Thalassospira xiamenensis]
MLTPYIPHPDFLISVAPTDPEDPASGKWLLHVNPREERFNASDGSLDESKLYLRYADVSRNRYERPIKYEYFDANYIAYRNTLSLVATVLFLDPAELRGHGVGTCMMNRIIDWAQEWPEAKVSAIDILDPDPDTVARRKHFYGKFGLVFDDKDGKPVMRELLVSELIKPENVSTITIHDLPVGLMRLSLANNEQKRRLSLNTNEIDDMKTQWNKFTARPVRTGLSHWFSNNLFSLMFCGVFLFFGACLWISVK